MKNDVSLAAKRDEMALQNYQMIAPLLDESLDLTKQLALRQQIAAENNISTRTLYRYEKIYREQGFGGLKPQQRIVKTATQGFCQHRGRVHPAQ